MPITRRVAIGLTALAILAIVAVPAAILVPGAALAEVSLLALVVAFAWPRSFALALVVVTLLLPTLNHFFPLGVLGDADEAGVVLAVLAFSGRRLISGRPLRRLPGDWAIAIFLVAGVISSYFAQVDPLLATQDAFLLLKGFLFAFAIAQLDWSRSDVRRMAVAGAVILSVILVSVAADALMPAKWGDLFYAEGRAARAGVISLVGLFDHPGPLGQTMALAAIALLIYRSVVRKNLFTLVLLIGSFLGAFASVRRKAVIGLLAVTGWFGFRRRPLATTLVVLLGLPLAIVLFRDSLASLVDGVYVEYLQAANKAARTMLYLGSLQVAVAHGALGAGFSQYGGFIAGVNYSPIYSDLGFEKVWGLQPGGAYLTDTFWPAILGETGFLGTAGLVAALVVLALRGRVLVRTDDPYLRWLGYVGIGWSLEYAFESVASAVYSSPPTYLLLFTVLGVIGSIVHQQRAQPFGVLPAAEPETARDRLVAAH